MSEVKFTNEQQSVIDARNCNILVSAAAGSGKTAVLVERIIQLITNPNDNAEPLDIDHLLVVTFTRAAASQMKDKISAAIAKRLQQEPDNAHLQKQETLIHNAQITTIDSFCQYIIRNNFNDIGLDPSYTVADPGEIKLIEENVMADFLEGKYETADEDFKYTAEYFSNGSSDKGLEEQIFRLYHFSSSMPWPMDWLLKTSHDYDIDEDSFDNKDWIREYVEEGRLILNGILLSVQRAIDISNEPDGPHMYTTLLESEKAMIEKAASCTSYEQMRDFLSQVTFNALSRKKDDCVSPDKREMAKSIRDAVKKSIKDLQDEYFVLDKEGIIATSKLTSRALKCLCELTIEFKNALDDKKREQNIIDFVDMEHYALNILINHDSKTGKNTPTDVACQYRNYYKEILIDEYQDSNSVQELILSAISGNTGESYDRFMVGDVKQSIYKFRLAKPEIFMDKLYSYDKSDKAPLRRIDLHKNFRSRRRVLDYVNFIFRRIMGTDLGGVAYDEDAMLVPGASFPSEPEGTDSFVPELILIQNEDEKASDNPVSQDGDSEEDADESHIENLWGMEDESLEAGQKLNPKQKEAMVIAKRIKELIKNGHVSDGNGGFREVHYKDIVILLRAPAGMDDTFRRILESEGIPAYVESRTGYFVAIEVSTLLNCLKIIDNPLLDIPLVSVMHSPLGNFSDKELAAIKAFTKEKIKEENREAPENFYENLRFIESFYLGAEAGNAPEIPEEGIEGELFKKVHNFLLFLKTLRQKSVYMPVHELLEYIMDTTKYRNYVTAMPGGSRRRANVDMLLERAASFENTSFKGLFNFIRYIEKLEKYEVDFGEANVIDENADVVRIMSIHKSKGLEFPIVFVAGTSKGFNKKEANTEVIFDENLGIGLNYVNLDLRIKANTPRRKLISDRMKKESLGEELRVLYVALTRAKEKLIITGSVKDVAKVIKNEQHLAFSKGPNEQKELLPLLERKGTSNYLTLIMKAMMGHPSMKDAADAVGADVSLIDYDKIIVSESSDSQSPIESTFIVPPARIEVVFASEISSLIFKQQVDAVIRKDKLGDSISSEDIDDELYKRLSSNFAYEYSHKDYEGLYTKTTVSELKKASFNEENEPDTRIIRQKDEEYVPSFAFDKEYKLSGTLRGSAYHRVMELLDENILSESQIQISSMQKWLQKKEIDGMIDAEAVEGVDLKDIIAFFDTDLGKRYKKAALDNRLYKERQFMMGIPATELSKNYPDGEIMLIQGVIDAWFEEKDGLVLIDYKTDNIKTLSELVARYKIQIDYYTRALERMTHKRVIERHLYSFKLGKSVII